MDQPSNRKLYAVAPLIDSASGVVRQISLLACWGVSCGMINNQSELCLKSQKSLLKFELLLCATSVFSVSLWLYWPENHHRDTENTEVAQSNLSNQVATAPCTDPVQAASRPLRQSHRSDWLLPEEFQNDSLTELVSVQPLCSLCLVWLFFFFKQS